MIKPPKYAASNAKKALACIKKGSKAMTSIGKTRARQLAARKPLSNKDLKDISQFKRHQKNATYKGDFCKDKGAVAWLGWGNSLRKGKGIADFSRWAKRKLK